MLGVLGGMGPAAGAYFAYRLAQLTDAHCDQDHLPVLLVNDPQVPDRSEAALGQGRSPLPAMLRGLRLLESGGCRGVAMPCNTAHCWFDDLQASIQMPLLHIVSASVQALRDQGVDGGKIGLLGTPATVASGLYQSQLQRAGYEVLPLSDDEVQRHCVAPIHAVKQGRPEAAGKALALALDALHRRGAHAVILGCTELPLAHAALGAAAAALTVIDSIDALAISALNHFGYAVKQPHA